MDQRKINASRQRIFLVKMEYTTKEIVFHVLGTTNHLYKVKYNLHKWNCSCPDAVFRKHITCKHTYFMQNIILKESLSDLTTLSDLCTCLLLKFPHLDNIDIVDDEKQVQDISQRNQECCICIEELESNVSVCSHCLNGVHKTCWEKYTGYTKKKNCPYCRNIMKVDLKLQDCLGNKLIIN